MNTKPTRTQYPAELPALPRTSVNMTVAMSQGTWRAKVVSSGLALGAQAIGSTYTDAVCALHTHLMAKYPETSWVLLDLARWRPHGLSRNQLATLRDVRDGTGGGMLRHFDVVDLRASGHLGGSAWRPELTDLGASALYAWLEGGAL
jgi:hypothetical protein